MADWKRVYTAANGETALYELEAFGKKNRMANTQNLTIMGVKLAEMIHTFLRIRRRLKR